MNLFLWMLTGAILGWAAFSVLDLNEARGKLASMVIGGIGGVIGGKVIAPMFTTVPAATPDAFSMSAVLFAAAVAAALLAIGNQISIRWDV